MDADDYEGLLPEGWTARTVARGERTRIEARHDSYTVEVDDAGALVRAIGDYERYGAGARGREPHVEGRI